MTITCKLSVQRKRTAEIIDVLVLYWYKYGVLPKFTFNWFWFDLKYWNYSIP